MTVQEVRVKRKQKIRKVSVVDQVCDSIKEDLVNGVWKEGEKLPSEGEFADMFEVNRLSVRMALQKLSTLGFIETRVGEGSFAKKFSLKPILSEIAVFYEEEDKYNDVCQLRFLLESESLRLAVEKSTDEEKERLDQLLNHYYEAMRMYHKNESESEKYLDLAVEADFEFHYQIIRMSHNELFKDIYYMVRMLVRDHIKQLVSRRTQARREKGLPMREFKNDTHEQMYFAIINKDKDIVMELSKKMLGMEPIEGLDILI